MQNVSLDTVYLNAEKNLWATGKLKKLSSGGYWWVTESGFEGMLQSSVWEESIHSIICIRRDTVTASLIKSILVVICKGLWTTSWIFYKTWFSVL